MAAVLALACCGPRLEVTLSRGGGAAVGAVALAGPIPRSDLVMAAVDLLLAAGGLSPTDLTGVAVTRGPGSFTGVRVGLATAQGLAAALGVPARGYSSLCAQAARCRDELCLAIQPARRGSVYAQSFRRGPDGPHALDEPSIRPTAELADSAIPVIAPAGVELPAETPLATPLLGTAEALLALFAADGGDDASLLPLYAEAPTPVTLRGSG
jgi:tRNA threonylcarbamoyl adenosine modification protein YeaZ